jgi:hypothetical protein
MHSLLRRHLIGWLVGPDWSRCCCYDMEIERRGGTSQSVLDITVGGDVVSVLLATLWWLARVPASWRLKKWKIVKIPVSYINLSNHYLVESCRSGRRPCRRPAYVWARSCTDTALIQLLITFAGVAAATWAWKRWPFYVGSWHHGGRDCGPWCCIGPVGHLMIIIQRRDAWGNWNC